MTTNLSNLEDSIGGVIGSSLSKIQVIKNKESDNRKNKFSQNRQTIGDGRSGSKHNFNKSPDVVGNRGGVFNNSKERLEKTSNGGGMQ